MVHRTRALVEYLRDFVRTAHKPVRDCREDQEVLWLASLPDTVPRPRAASDGVLLAVDHWPRRPAPALPEALEGWLAPEAVADAGAGDPLVAETGPGQGWVEGDNGGWVEVGEIRREDAAEVLQTFGGWLPRWRKWAAEERAAEPQRELHGTLLRIARRVQNDGDVYEAVLGVGLLTRRPDQAERLLHRHLLTAPLAVTVDPDTVRVTVSLLPDARVELEDGDFLDETDGYSSALLGPLRSRADSGDLHPLSREAEEILASWAERALGTERSVRFEPVWEQPPAHPRDSDASLRLRTAPALLLRKRGRGALVGFYDKIARQLAQPDAVSPLGLAQLLLPLSAQERVAWSAVDGGAVPPALGPDPLFPLPVNKAQHEVLHRLHQDTGVVVQGPPGTGKTHTIANLVCALLADGKRVLVTSEKDQALRVLRDKLPPKLRSLCVFQGDVRQSSDGELEQSIRMLSQRTATTSTAQLTLRIAELTVHRDSLATHRARLLTALRELREAEWYEHPEIAPGYRGRLAEIVEAVVAGQQRHGWLPPLPKDAPGTPGLGADETQRLLALINRHGVAVLKEQDARCPDPEDLPAPAAFAEAVTVWYAAERVAAESSADPLAEEISERGSELLDSLREHLDEAEQALQQEGLALDVAGWMPGDWCTSGLDDLLSGSRTALWTAVRRDAEQAAKVQDELANLTFAHIEVPGDLDPGQAARLTAAGNALERHVRDGGKVRQRFRKPVQREAEPLLTQCAVDGRSPTTAAEIAAVVLHLRARQAVSQLNRSWVRLGVLAVDGPLEAALSELLDRTPRLKCVWRFSVAAQGVHAALLQARIRATVRNRQEWKRAQAAVIHAQARLALRDREQELLRLAESLPVQNARSVPELADAHRAMAVRDPQVYEKAVKALTAAYHREADRREARKLLEKLAVSHPVLARALAETPDDPTWGSRLTGLAESWAWQRARAFRDRMLTPGREAKLEGELDEVEAQLRTTTEDLAADRALLHCMQRMTAEQKQALNAYANAVSRAGKGTTAQGRRHLKAARSAMGDARGAVPAWVMPVKQIAAMIEPNRDAFDVVIVDEASQIGLEG
ncbi:AAA domain-containing protein, partial [Frankia sp. Cr1]|uniref:AAA domain-containing protein n=1 Tax=Frankia sp. Cr1 TaxID=3073931 RepID=UPI002AD26194